MTPPLPGGRYAQCDDSCTTDCGACKGSGWPASGGTARTQPTDADLEAAAVLMADVVQASRPNCVGYAVDLIAQALADQRAWYERVAAERAAQVLERSYTAHRTTVSKLSQVEQLTCFIVKVEDLVMDAAALRAASREETGR